MSTPELRASSEKYGAYYRGAIREGQKVIWRCDHLHNNRSMSPGIRQSAVDCAAVELRRRGIVGTLEQQESAS